MTDLDEPCILDPDTESWHHHPLHLACWLNGDFIDRTEDGIIAFLRAIAAVLHDLPEDFPGSCESPEFVDVFTTNINRELVAVRQAIVRLRVLGEADQLAVDPQTGEVRDHK